MDIKVRRVFRSNSVIGMAVKTPDHKNLGEIEEIAIDLSTGKVAYAVLSFGGFFGFADKFFAVPWDEFSLVHDEQENYFTIDTTREQLKHLPGFDKEAWPDIANSDWDLIVDEHYQSTQASDDSA